MRTKQLVLTALFAALTAIGAFLKIQIPVEGIPAITLQFFFTAMAGRAARREIRRDLAGGLCAARPCGASDFYDGRRIFLRASTELRLSGRADPERVGHRHARKNAKSFWPMALGILAGLAVLYLIGTPYMGLILNLYLGKGMSVWQIVRAGCLLYLPGDVLKIVVCTALCLALRSRLPKALAAA